MAANTTPARKPAAPKTTTPATGPTPAKASSAPVEATTVPADAPKTGKPNGSRDGLFGRLASGAKEVDTMPTQTKNGSSRINPFAALVKDTFVNDKPRELDPIPADDMERVVAAVRRGAAKEGLGVNVVHSINEDGQAVITFKGKKKDIR